MITLALFKCRRCGVTYHYPGELKQEDVLFAQISIHECKDVAADGHYRRGISDMVGFNVSPNEVEG